MRQKNQFELNLGTGTEGEAQSAVVQEAEARAARTGLERPAVAAPSMEAVVEGENLKKALAQVKRNKGAAGIDGMNVGDLLAHLKEHWPTIRAQLLEGTYKPQPVRRVEIPKASGGTRPLGIPTVLDRFIQQAVMQVLQADWPVRLQHLHRRLLDKAVEHRGYPQRPCAAGCLRYLHPSHRLWLIAAIKQLAPDRGPVLLQVGHQVLDTHPVEAGRPLVALYSLQCLPQVLTLDNRFHGRPSCRRAFDVGSRRAGFSLSGGGASGFTRCAAARAQLSLCLLLHRLREIAALLASSTVQAFGGAPRLLCPLLTSALRSRRLATPSVPLPGQQRRPPEVRTTAFAARLPDLPPRPLMAVDFAITCSLVRPGRPRYPVLVHQAATLLHASFRPHLAM